MTCDTIFLAFDEDKVKNEVNVAVLASSIALHFNISTRLNIIAFKDLLKGHTTLSSYFLYLKKMDPVQNIGNLLPSFL